MAIYKDLVTKISVPSDKKIKQKNYLGVGLLPIIDQSHSMIGGYTNDLTKAIECDFPVIIFGDHTKCVKLVSFPFAPGADGIKVLQPKPGILPKYLYYGTQYLTLRTESKGYARHYQYIQKKDLAVPTDSEQKCIVSKIEELFSRLDASVAELQTAKEKLKVYRQAVLKDAFAEFRIKKPIREVTSIVTSGSRGWAKYYSSHGAKFIRIGNLTSDSIKVDCTEMQYVILPKNAEGTRTKLQTNDVLVSITANLGSIGLVPDAIGDAYINQHIALVRFTNPNQSEFMAWYLRSDLGQKDLLKNKRGAGKLGLGLDDIRETKIPLVSDEQAVSVVSSINSRLSVCDSIEQTIDTSLQQAESLRQSILKQAFEGNL